MGQLGVKSKIYSFLWALWLEVGPDQSLLRWNSGQIFGFTTDRGTERAIADAPDVSKELFASLGVEYTLPPRQYLFIKAIWIPGFHHLMDGAVEQVLASITFWPGWLAMLKSATKFLRIDTHRERVIITACSLDFDTSRLRDKPPSFAKWRWDTLAEVMGWFERSYTVLVSVFGDCDMFRTSQDAAAGRELCKTMRDRAWWAQFLVRVGHRVCRGVFAALGRWVQVPRGAEASRGRRWGVLHGWQALA